MMFICETKELHFAYDIYLFVYIKIINKYTLIIYYQYNENKQSFRGQKLSRQKPIKIIVAHIHI
jgi:hypothetical protein